MQSYINTRARVRAKTHAHANIYAPRNYFVLFKKIKRAISTPKQIMFKIYRRMIRSTMRHTQPKLCVYIQDL